MADKVTKEICTTNDSIVYVPVASTSEVGVASFNSEDFAVSSDGKVSLLHNVVSISAATVDDSGNLILTLTDGTKVNCGNVVLTL